MFDSIQQIMKSKYFAVSVNLLAIAYIIYNAAWWLWGVKIPNSLTGLILWKTRGGYDNALDVFVTLIFFFVLGYILQKRFPYGFLMAGIAIGASDYMIQVYVQTIIGNWFWLGVLDPVLEISVAALLLIRFLMSKNDANNFMGRILIVYLIQLIPFIIWKLSGIPPSFIYTPALVDVNLYNLTICSWVIFLWISQMALTFCVFVDLKPSDLHK